MFNVDNKVLIIINVITSLQEGVKTQRHTLYTKTTEGARLCAQTKCTATKNMSHILVRMISISVHSIRTSVRHEKLILIFVSRGSIFVITGSSVIMYSKRCKNRHKEVWAELFRY